VNASDENYEAPIVPITSAAKAKKYPLTEAGNSERFADRYRDRLLYVPSWSTWMLHDATHWRRDEQDVRVLGLAKDSNRSIAVEAQACSDNKEYGAYLDWARSSERLANRVATVKGARSEVTTVEPQDFDSDPMLLNFTNGTVELETGQLREHRAADRITRVLPWSYDATATCPRFETFLSEVLPDAATVEYFWRAFGYSLTGRIDEHAVFFAHGRGANGKSTLFGVLTAALTPYAVVGSNDLLLAKHGEQHPVGLADLHGRRLVACSEINEHRRWDAATLKSLTGGDRITARRMRENFWSFDPTHKFWIAANAKPAAAATDEALWRRIKLIAFGRKFEGATKDPMLPAKLRAEIPGILRRAVEGCLRWQESGLGEPTAVTEAVADYRREVDPLAGFFEARERGPLARITRAALRGEYEAWSHSRGEEPMSPKAFTERVRSLDGVTEAKVKDRGGVPRDGWRGIGPVASSEEVETKTGDDGYVAPHERVIGKTVATTSLPLYGLERGPEEDDL
jgi:putative DNA primase/helicase